MYEAGYRFRGLEFQVEPPAPEATPAFHLVLAVPCDKAGDDHWPCTPDCEGHRRPLDEWYEIPNLTEARRAMPEIRDHVLRAIATCPVDLAANAALWDGLHTMTAQVVQASSVSTSDEAFFP